MMPDKTRMRSHRGDGARQLEYLLGNLTEEEQVEVEDRAFADEDYLSALEDTEADLIDAYVRGELSQSDRRRFELRFLSSAERRRKVEFARALATITAESAHQESRAAGRRFFMSAFWGWNPVAQFAAAAAAVIAIAGGAWLVSENAAIRSRVATLEAERRGFEAREQSLRQQLSEEQNRAAALATQNRPPSEVAPAPLVATLVFVPGLSRAQTRAEQLVLNASVQMARLEVQLESRDDFPRFRAELRTRGGEEVLVRSNLARQKSGPAFAVSLEVPASALPAGDYELAIRGIAADRSSQDVGYYYFGVQRR
jgi:hypothetical protein